MLHLLLVIAFIVQRTCSIFTSPPCMKIIQMKMKIGFKYKYVPYYARDGKDSAHNPCQLSNAQLSHISLLRNKYSQTRDRFEFRFSLFIFGCFFVVLLFVVVVCAHFFVNFKAFRRQNTSISFYKPKKCTKTILVGANTIEMKNRHRKNGCIDVASGD